jgi:hypothetical protein
MRLRRLSEPTLERVHQAKDSSASVLAEESDTSSSDDELSADQLAAAEAIRVVQASPDGDVQQVDIQLVGAHRSGTVLAPHRPNGPRSQRKLEHIFGENVSQLLQPPRSKHKLARVLGELPSADAVAAATPTSQLPNGPSWMFAVQKLLHRNVEEGGDSSRSYRLSRRKPLITVTTAEGEVSSATRRHRGSVGTIIVSAKERSVHVDFEFSWDGDDPVSQFELCAKVGQGCVFTSLHALSRAHVSCSPCTLPSRTRRHTQRAHAQHALGT